MNKRPWWKRLWRFFLCLGVLGLIAALLLGYLQGLHPAFDSFSHFRLILLGLLAIGLILLALNRLWKWFGAGLVTTVAGLFLTHPHLLFIGPSYTPSPDGQLRVVQMNLLFKNRQTDAAVRALLSEPSDVIILQELTRFNRTIFNRLKATHPHQYDCAAFSVGSVAVASRHPFTHLSERRCYRWQGFLSASIKFNGQNITIASLHTRWPWPFQQNDQIESLSATLQRLNKPLVLAGDFNAAPWSAVVQRVAAMTNTIPAPGVLHTWSIDPLRFPPFLSLDQTLASKHFQVLERKVLPFGGSDHLPVFTRLKIVDR